MNSDLDERNPAALKTQGNESQRKSVNPCRQALRPRCIVSCIRSQQRLLAVEESRPDPGERPCAESSRLTDGKRPEASREGGAGQCDAVRCGIMANSAGLSRYRVRAGGCLGGWRLELRAVV